MFKPHKDTEKAQRMFGTLAVLLPCAHTGGALVLSFNGKREVYTSAADAEWASPYFAWFADVLHEVRCCDQLIATRRLLDRLSLSFPVIA